MKKLHCFILSIFFLSGLGFQTQAQFTNGSPFPKNQVKDKPYMCGNQIHFKTQSSSTFLTSNDGLNWFPATSSCNPNNSLLPNEVNLSAQEPQETFHEGYKYQPFKKFTVAGKTYYVVRHDKVSGGSIPAKRYRYQIAYVEFQSEDNLNTRFIGPRVHTLMRLFVHPQNPNKWVIAYDPIDDQSSSKVSFLILNADGKSVAKQSTIETNTHNVNPPVAFYHNKLYIDTRHDFGKIIVYNLAPASDNNSFTTSSKEISLSAAFSASPANKGFRMFPTPSNLLVYATNWDNTGRDLGRILSNDTVETGLLERAKINTSFTTTPTVSPTNPNIKKPSQPTFKRKTIKTTPPVRKKTPVKRR